MAFSYQINNCTFCQKKNFSIKDAILQNEEFKQDCTILKELKISISIYALETNLVN